MFTPMAEALDTDLNQKRRTDAQPGEPVAMRNALAKTLRNLGRYVPGMTETTQLAAETLERDEQNNAEMIAVLARAGYRDIPPRINAAVIRRLLGYATPQV
jgi:hypothetical protein